MSATGLIQACSKSRRGKMADLLSAASGVTNYRVKKPADLEKVTGIKVHSCRSRAGNQIRHERVELN